MSTDPRVAASERLVVPDVLRGVAILAMLIAHAVPLLTVFAPGVRFVMGTINDLASPLFALVMGLSAQLVLARTPQRPPWAMWLQQSARAVALIALGLWMFSWGSWVVVVLSYLGVLLLVGVPMLLLPTRWIGILTVGLVAVSDPVNAWARASLAPLVMESPALAHISAWVVLGSSYRLTNLLPFFLLGALLMRHGFRRDRYLWAMAVVAPIAYVVRPIIATMTDAASSVSGSYADTVHDAGLVLGVYVVIVLLATARTPRVARVVSIVFEPLRSIGAVALSLYVVHVALIAIWVHSGLVVVGNDYLRWLVLVPGMVVAGWLWWRFIGVGPIEWLMGWVTFRPKGRPAEMARR